MQQRCVVLDIGGVLEFTPDTGWPGRWERRLGLPAGAVDERLADVWHAGSVGTIDATAVRSEVAARLGLDAAGADALLGDLWTEYLGTPNTELLAYVRELRGRCGLGILSNSFAGARERESAAYGFDTLVDQLHYSHETGVLKPDPRAYEAVCAALGASPGDCLFIDDFPPNIEAARAAGLPAHLFEDNPATLTRIAAHVGPAV